MRNLNVSPIISTNNSADSILINRKSFSNLLLSEAKRGQSSDLYYLFGRELRLPVSFTEAVAFLRNLVAHIVRMCSEKKVGWINTSAVVATMKNAHSLRDLSEMEFVGNSVCVGVSVRSLSPNSDSERAISVLVSAPNPIPTVGGFIYEFEKSIDNWFTFWSRYGHYGRLAFWVTK